MTIREDPQLKKYDPHHHAMLAYCTYKGDTFLWNDWRKYNSDTKIHLEGADLSGSHPEGAFLREANLKGARLSKANLKLADLFRANLEDANLRNALLKGAKLSEAHLEGADLIGADLVAANLREAHLEGANLNKADLERVDLQGAHLEGAHLWRSNLKGAKLIEANLQEADFKEADLQNAWLKGSNLHSANFKLARVNGDTSITECKFDKKTDFTGVGLDAVTIVPELKVAFKNNIRRIRWQKWTERAPTKWEKWYRKTVKLFWLLSNYGSSTKKILGWFFGLAGFFGLIYCLFAVLPGSHSIIEELRLADGNKQPFNNWHILARSLYFSVVTMTTLGFGDMHAAKTGGWPSYLGYLFLSIQVMLGYVMLGALVTRMGILFTSEAPAADPESDYDPEKKEEKSRQWIAFDFE